MVVDATIQPMSDTKTNTTIQHEVVSTINDGVKEIVEFFINEGWVPEDYIPSVRIDFLLYRRRSRGGRSSYDRSFVSLETSRFLDPNWDFFSEYKRFENDPEIGTVTGDRIRAIKTMVAHELCHAVQFGPYARRAAQKIGFTDRSQMKGHKMFWQTLYRLTRRALLNPSDTPQINPGEKKEMKYTSPLPPLKRKDAIKEIQRLANDEGMSRDKILLELMVMRGMKRSTCQVYISQAGPGVGTRPRKAKIKASNLNEFGIVVGQ